MEVEGVSTHDITQEQAAVLLDRDSPSVTITVAKMAAAYYGIFSEEGQLNSIYRPQTTTFPVMYIYVTMRV